MTYNEKSFSGCRFNPLNKELFTNEPGLFSLTSKEMSHTIDVGNAIRYVIALYDPNSPLRKDETNLARRKEIAADIAGFDLKKDEKTLDNIWNCRDDGFVELTQNFLKIHGRAMEWAMITSFEQTFWEYQATLMRPIERADKDKDLISGVSLKTKLSEDIQTLYDKYQTALSKFYGEDKALIDAAARTKRWTPENVGKK